MKLSKSKFLIAGLCTLFISTNLVTSFGEGSLEDIMSKYSGMDTEEVYEMKINDTKEELLGEIRKIENVIKVKNESMVLLPFLVAIIDKKDEFTEDELISLITDEKQGVILKSALIKIYKEKGCDESKIKLLLENEYLDEESKDYIVAIFDYSVNELEVIFDNNDGNIAITSIKRLMMKDSKVAYDLIKEDYLAGKNLSNEKQIASYLAIGEYFKNYEVDEYEKTKIIKCMKADFESENNERVKDQVIYSLSKMNDLEILKSIIYNDNIDYELKITAIDRNRNLLLNILNAKSTSEDIGFVIEAMKINPIVEIGKKMAEISSYNVNARNKGAEEIIAYIIENGTEGESRYE